MCIEVSAKSRSLVQRSPTDCGVFQCDRGTLKGSFGPLVLWNYAKKEKAFAGIFEKENYFLV